VSRWLTTTLLTPIPRSVSSAAAARHFNVNGKGRRKGRRKRTHAVHTQGAAQFVSLQQFPVEVFQMIPRLPFPFRARIVEARDRTVR
jgi:hypothetical protein